MIIDLIIMWIRFYPLLSIIIFIMFYLSSIIKPSTSNPFDVLKDMNNLIEEMHETMPKVADFLEYSVNEAVEGNQFPVMMIALFFCFIPVVRLIILREGLFS